MTKPSTRPRDYQGPAILSYGFRPFFFLAGVWAFGAMLVWILMLTGREVLPLEMGAVDWHVHEFLFGYLSAVVAGFILTAIPNWTGRLPITGWRLLVLVLLWIAGRLVMATSALLAPLLVAGVDLLFLAALSLAILREILAGRNWRNLPVFAMISLMVIANALFHAENITSGTAATGYGSNLAIAVVVMLISLIGGRIVPSFTRNWLVKNQSQGPLPAPTGRLDMAILLFSGLTLLAWLVEPEARLSGFLMILAGFANLWRLARWQGRQSTPEPLLWVLHVGFLYIPLGFLFIGGAVIWPDVIPPFAAKHAWLVGAFGTMTLAVMTRATLGHTGRELRAGPGITLIFLLILGAGFLRVLAGFWPGEIALLHASAAFWIGAYGLFTILFAPLLLRPKEGAKAASRPGN